MTTDACATPGCGHAKSEHHDDDWGCWHLGQPMGCSCAAYLPPRPVPEEGTCACGHQRRDHRISDGFCAANACCGTEKCDDTFIPATVPAPHAEAEAAWEDHCEMTQEQLSNPDFWAMEKTAFIAGYLRGRGDRG